MKELTFREFRDSKESLAKLFKLPGLPDWEEAIKVAAMKKPFDEIDNAHAKASNSIFLKYMKMAEKRKSEIMPKGFNSVEEQESNLTETEEFLNSPVGVKMDIPVLKKETIKHIMKKDKENEVSFSLNDLSVFSSLGMIEK